MSQIPERTFTFQYKPLTSLGESGNTPSVADGTEIKLFAESIKEIYQKEPSKQAIQRGPQDHFKGDKQLLIDSMNDKHKFEVTAYVYARGDDGQANEPIHSLPPFNRKATTTSFRNGDGTATVSDDKIRVGAFGEAQPLGDTGVVHDSETVEASTSGTLTRGTDYELDYGRGEITIKEGALNSTEEDVRGPLGIIDLGTNTVIQEDITVSYDIEVSARNVASQVVRMAQLGNPLVMRLDKRKTTGPGDTRAARGFLVTPVSVNVVSESEKPNVFKLEMELRKGEAAK